MSVPNLLIAQDLMSCAINKFGTLINCVPKRKLKQQPKKLNVASPPKSKNPNGSCIPIIQQRTTAEACKTHIPQPEQHLNLIVEL